LSRYAVLIGQVQQGLQDLNQLVIQTEALLKKVEATGDLDYLGMVALNLHSFYSGAERLFRDVALDVDQALSEGSDWHRRLLRQMGAEVPGCRPVLLQQPTLKALNELCAFRHVVRNIYSFELNAERVQALASLLPSIYELLRADLLAFQEFLSTVNG
jgi:hypothetical protein